MTESEVYKVLQEINSRVPKAWKEGVIVQKANTPVMAKVVDEALNSPNTSPERKKQLQELKDAGYFDKKKFSEDPAIAKKINAFTMREINKAVKEGRLPNKRKLAELKIQWQNQRENSSKS